MRRDHEDSSAPTLRKIKIPPFERPTPEKIERRREVVARMLRLRDEIGPIGISTADLIREVRDEEDGVDE